MTRLEQIRNRLESSQRVTTGEGTITAPADQVRDLQNELDYLLQWGEQARALVEDLRGYVLHWQCPEPCDHAGCTAHRALLARADAFLEDKA